MRKRSCILVALLVVGILLILLVGAFIVFAEMSPIMKEPYPLAI